MIVLSKIRNENRRMSYDIQENEIMKTILKEDIIGNSISKLNFQNNLSKKYTSDCYSNDSHFVSAANNIKKIIKSSKTNLHDYMKNTRNFDIQNISPNVFFKERLPSIKNFSSYNLKKQFKTIGLNKNLMNKKINLEKLKAYTKKRELNKLKSILPLQSEESLDYKNQKFTSVGKSKMEGYTEILIDDRIEFVKTTLANSTRANTENNKTYRNVPVINGKVNLNCLYSKEEYEKDKTNRYSVRIIEKNGEAAYEYYKKCHNKDKNLPFTKNKLRFINNTMKSDKVKGRIRGSLTIEDKSKLYSSVDNTAQNHYRNLSNDKPQHIHFLSNNFLTDHKPLLHLNNFILQKDKVIKQISDNKNKLTTLSDKMNSLLMKALIKIKKETNPTNLINYDL